MNIYLLERIVDDTSPVWDCAFGFVVAALDEAQARQTVADVPRGEEGPGDEGRDVWLSDTSSRIEQVGVATGTIEPYVILRDFHAG